MSVSTLSNTVDGLSNTVSNNSGNITTLQTRANGFDVSVGQLQTQVNNSAVGTNLLIGTSSTNNTTISGTDWYTLSSATNRYKVPLKTNTTYTYSVNMVSATYTWYLEVQEFDSSGNWLNNIGRNPGDTSTGKQSITFTTSSNASMWQVHVVLANPSTTQTLVWNSEKLELGSHATDWSANPADNATVMSVSTLSNTVDGLSNTVSNNSGNISNLQTSVTGLKDTVSDNSNNISTLQNSATTFESDISGLQSDNTTNKQNISSLQNTANGFSSTVATLQTQVNNSAVGTNLIIASSVINSVSMDNNGANTGFPTTFITDYIEVVAGESYTVSTTLSSSRSRIAFYDSSKNFISRLDNTAISNSSPQTFTIPNGASFIKFSPDESNGKYENNFKLEKGSHATDWSANPADNATVMSVSTLSNTVDGLSNTVSNNSGNITTLQTRANGFDVSVGQLQTQVNNSAVGTNLLIGTSSTNNTTISGTDWYTLSSATNRYKVPLKTNTTYTYSVNMVSATYTWYLEVQEFDSSGNWLNNIGRNPGDTSTGKQSITFTTSSNASMWQVHVVLANPSTTQTLVWNSEKLELGSHATDWCLSPSEQLASTGNYAGLTINSNGLTQVAGSTSVYLSNTHGFEIQKSGSDIFHVDTSGNLTMQGNITAGNISGVNFTGNSLTLAGTLAVTGSISADNGNVVINSSGLTIKGAGLTIGDSSGNTTTYIKSDGTFVTNKGVFSGSVTSSNVTITGGDINMNGGNFHVDSSGNVTANSINITGGAVSAGVISGTLDADNIILKGTDSTLHISGNDLMFQENSGEKWITDIDSNGISFTGYAPSTSRQEFLGGLFINYEFEDEDINGLYLTVTTGANMHSIIPNANGDEIGINVPYVKSDNAGGYSEVNDFKVIYNASGALRQAGLHIYDDSYYSAMDPLLSGNASESGHINCSETDNFVIESLLQNLVFNSPKGKNVIFQGNGSGGGVVFNSLANLSKSAIVGSGNSGDQIWVRGDGNFDGTVSCKSLTRTSLLSKKTNISKIDPATALDKINQTNIYDYQFKSDVEQGSAKHYASFIIDDVNEIPKYKEPDEFLSEDKKGRDDGTLLAYAVVVIKELIKQNSDLQMRVTKLEIEGNNK